MRSCCDGGGGVPLAPSGRSRGAHLVLQPPASTTTPAQHRAPVLPPSAIHTEASTSRRTRRRGAPVAAAASAQAAAVVKAGWSPRELQRSSSQDDLGVITLLPEEPANGHGYEQEHASIVLEPPPCAGALPLGSSSSSVDLTHFSQHDDGRPQAPPNSLLQEQQQQQQASPSHSQDVPPAAAGATLGTLPLTGHQEDADSDGGETQPSELAVQLGRDLGVAPRRMHAILQRWPNQARQYSQQQHAEQQHHHPPEHPHSQQEQQASASQPPPSPLQHSQHTQQQQSQQHTIQISVERLSVQLHGLAAALRCTPRSAAALVAREPRLLTLPSDAIQQRLASLASHLALSHDELVPACQGHPALLFSPAADAASHLRANAEALRLTPAQLLSAAGTDDTWLLRAPAAVLAQRVAEVGAQLGTDLHASGLLARCPRLACMAGEDVRRKVAALRGALGVSRAVAQALLRRHPRVLELSCDALQAHMEGLRKVLELAGEQQEASVAGAGDNSDAALPAAGGSAPASGGTGQGQGEADAQPLGQASSAEGGATAVADSNGDSEGSSRRRRTGRQRSAAAAATPPIDQATAAAAAATADSGAPASSSKRESAGSGKRRPASTATLASTKQPAPGPSTSSPTTTAATGANAQSQPASQQPAAAARASPADVRLRRVVLQEPSVLLRSTVHLARVLRTLRELLPGCTRAQVVDLVARRPPLLTRSEASLRGSFNALSVWRLSGEDRRALVLAHPLLLRLSSREVHGRCRWLRALMLGSGYFHAALRRLPMKLLGVVIAHLPAAWGRLQYLVESSQEAGVDVMEVVQMPEGRFAALHPGYGKWMAWKCTAQGGPIPWVNNDAIENSSGWRKRPAIKPQVPGAPAALLGVAAPGPEANLPSSVSSSASSPPQRSEPGRVGLPAARAAGGGAPRRMQLSTAAQRQQQQRRQDAPQQQQRQRTTGADQRGGYQGAQRSFSSPLATGGQGVPPGEGEGAGLMHEVTEVHESRLLLVGSHLVRKPRRVVSTRVPVAEAEPAEAGVVAATVVEAAAAGSGTGAE